MYPLKFNPILKSTIWGGDKIIPFKHLDCRQAQVGESWEISDVPGDESVVASGADAGKNLTQMVNEYKGALVGEENYRRFNGKFPLLIKFIDAQDAPQLDGKDGNVVCYRQCRRQGASSLRLEQADYA